MSSKLVTIAEVAKHSKKSDLWVIISNKVYDVTKFVDEHPGGEEVINELAGADATEGFEDVGHSEDARDLLKEYYVGDLDTASVDTGKKQSNGGVAPVAGATGQPIKMPASQSSEMAKIFAVIALLVAVAAYKVLFNDASA